MMDAKLYDACARAAAEVRSALAANGLRMLTITVYDEDEQDGWMLSMSAKDASGVMSSYYEYDSSDDEEEVE